MKESQKNLEALHTKKKKKEYKLLNKIISLKMTSLSFNGIPIQQCSEKCLPDQGRRRRAIYPDEFWLVERCRVVGASWNVFLLR